ncbi:MAG: hypothetical protein WCI51_06375 [Lentisphaerota bacterium]
MKGKIIFSVLLFALAGVILAMQLPEKGPFRKATTTEIQKGTATVDQLLDSMASRNRELFNKCWDGSLSATEINNYCKTYNFAELKKLSIVEAIVPKSATDTLIIVGMLDSDPQTLEFNLKKNGDSYRIKDIKQ